MNGSKPVYRVPPEIMQGKPIVPTGALLLTPECQNLWLIAPKPLLLYEQAFIDQQDLTAILHPRKDTRFAAMKARSAEKLLNWGLLQSIDYQSCLTPETRGQIHKIAMETVRRYLPTEDQAFAKSKFYTLSIYTHERYAAYLEQVIYARIKQSYKHTLRG